LVRISSAVLEVFVGDRHFRMKFWIKAIVTVSLLAALLLGIEWREIADRVAALRWWAVAAAAGVLALQFPVTAWKWGMALRLHDRVFPQSFLLRVCCIGFFFNTFLPSGIGGDAYRVYRTLPPSGEKSGAISAVLVERVVGLCALLALGVFGAGWLASENLLAGTFLIVVLLVGASGVLGLLLIRFGWLKPLTTRLRRRELFRTFESNLRLVLRGHPAWPWLIAGSFFFQGLVALWMFFVFAAIGVTLNPAECVLLSAGAGIATVLPISINGLGVVEGSIAGVATALGLPFETAVLGALLNRLGLVPLSVLCGLVYLFDRNAAVKTPDE
jgi:glycosyltransferase 2 family protein